MATQGFFFILELRVQFCLLVCCTYPSLSTVNKEKNWTDQCASFTSGLERNTTDHLASPTGSCHIDGVTRSEVFRFSRFDDGRNNGADQVACRPDSSPETADGTTITTQRRDAESIETLGRSKIWHWWRWFQYSSSSTVHCCYSAICCIWFDVRTMTWLLVKILYICGGQCCTWATQGTRFHHQSNCCCIQTTG